jgi:hypothetical protein
MHTVQSKHKRGGIPAVAEEFEVKVLSIDVEAIRDKLRAIGHLDRQVPPLRP